MNRQSKRLTTTIVLSAAIAAVVVFVACGGSSGPSKDDIAKTAADFYRTLSDDPPAAYNDLSADCRARVSYLEFVTSTSGVRGFIGNGDVEVKNVKIIEQTHDHVSVTYDLTLKSDADDISLAGTLNPDATKHLAKEKGRWRFEDCSGYAAPARTPSASGQTDATPTFEPNSPAAVEADDDPSLPGEFVDLQSIYGGHWGNRDGVNTASHAQQAIDYSVQGLLPAGGPHWGAGPCPPNPDIAPTFCGPVPWGVYDKPFPAESVVHNMEHAGVVVWYNTTNRDLVHQLEELARRNLADGKFIVLMPYADIDPETIGLTAWGRRDVFPVDDYSDARVQRFIDALECRFDPERLCPDKQAPTPLPGNSA